MMSKVLANVFVPVLQNDYDFFIPTHINIRLVISIVGKMVFEISSGLFIPDDSTLLCRREDGTVLDVNASVLTAGIKNGEKLMLI